MILRKLSGSFLASGIIGILILAFGAMGRGEEFFDTLLFKGYVITIATLIVSGTVGLWIARNKKPQEPSS